jgi:hypothetical protein
LSARGAGNVAAFGYFRPEAEGFDFGLTLGIGADTFYINDTIGYVTYRN